MAKFRGKAVGTKTVNKAGGEAFKETNKLEFVSILLTSFVQDQFYRSEDETVKRVSELVNGLPDKKFVAKSAIYARTKFGMRSISHVVAAELAKIVKGADWSKKFFDKVVHRPDDMLEILAYYLKKYGKPIPNSVKKGFSNALGRYNEYELSKYRGENSDLKLIDLVNLIHPKPTEKNKAALAKLVKDQLKGKNTWEVKLTQAGQKAKTEEEKTELKADAWRELVKEKKIGYFALLRNLRNIIQQAPDVLPQALEMLTDRELIKKSLVMPFRYLVAVKEIQNLSGREASKTISALSQAVDIACENVPKLEGNNLIVLDSSGSMTTSTVHEASYTPADIGCLFAAILMKSCQADLMLFSDDAKYVTLNASDSTLTIANQIQARFMSAGTNFHAPFQRANRKYDRIVVLSDMQGWMGSADGYYRTSGNPSQAFGDYKKKYDANPTVFSFDLQGYGTLMFPEPQVYCLAGFSEKVFDIMRLLEQDRNALVKEIEKIEL